MSWGVGRDTGEAPASPCAPAWLNMMYPPAANTPASTATASTPTTVSQGDAGRLPDVGRRPRRDRSGRSSSGAGVLHWVGTGALPEGRGGPGGAARGPGPAGRA